MEGSSKDNDKVTGSGIHSSWFQEFDNNDIGITDSFHDIFGGLTDIECHPTLQTTPNTEPKRESPWETCKEGSSRTERKSQEEIHLQRSRSDEVVNQTDYGPPHDIDREERKKQHNQRPKRTRSAEMHNASEKRRRNRIKGRLTALQGLIPNCHKDKASMLEDAVEYLKSLKLQVEMMSMAGGGAMCQASYMPQAGIPSVQIPHFSPYISIRPNPAGMGMFSMCQYSAGLPMISLPSTYLHSSPSAAGQLHPMSAHGHLPVAQVQMPFNSSAASATLSTALPRSATGFSAAAFSSPNQGESTSQTRRNNAI